MTTPQYERTIAVGDIHGCTKEFAELLQLIKYDRNRDRLICLGDYFDRGPDPLGTIHMIQDIGAEAILGNHDQKHLKYAGYEMRREEGKFEGKNPIQLSPERAAQNLQMTAADRKWLASLPVTIRFEIQDRKWIAVHGGFLPKIPIERQRAEMVVRVACVDAITGKMVSLDQMTNPKYSPTNWTTTWTGPLNVIYGHQVHNLEGNLELRIIHDTEKNQGYATIGTDTGCCFGGYLSAIVWNNTSTEWLPKHFKVKAHKQYAERRGLTS